MGRRLRRTSVFPKEKPWARVDSLHPGFNYLWGPARPGHGGAAPQVCPVCAHPQAYFELRAVNY